MTRQRTYLIAVILGLALPNGLTRATVLEKGQIYLFETCSHADRFMCFGGYLGKTTSIENASDRQCVTFRVVSALANGGDLFISLESVDHPGHFVSCQDSEICLRRANDAQFRPQDATFKALRGTPYGVQFESSSRPGYFMYVRNSRIYLEREDNKSGRGFRYQTAWIPVRLWLNFAGDERYIKSSAQATKIYLTLDALAHDQPTKGFNQCNTYANSCGPDAAFNMMTWYGIDKLAGTMASRPLDTYDRETGRQLPGLPAGTRHEVPVITVPSLGSRMKTNDWKICGIEASGTSIENFVSVTRSIFKDHMPPGYTVHYKHSTRGVDAYYDCFRYLLARGNPIVVLYKTGSWGDYIFKGKSIGHFAVIVGVEHHGDPASILNATLIVANGSRMSWGKFKDVWERSDMPFSRELMGAVGEYPYTAIYATQSEWQAPPTHGGADRPPRHLK